MYLGTDVIKSRGNVRKVVDRLILKTAQENGLFIFEKVVAAWQSNVKDCGSVVHVILMCTNDVGIGTQDSMSQVFVGHDVIRGRNRFCI